MRQAFFVAVLLAACFLPLVGCSGPDSGGSDSGGDPATTSGSNTTSP